MLTATYHTHSTFSDGRGTIDEMIDAAAAMWVDELGFSDHLTIDPLGRDLAWAMRRERVSEYVATVTERSKRRVLPHVRLGLEVDWIEGNAEEVERALHAIPNLDFVLGSVHLVGRFSVDGSRDAWAALSVDEVNEVHRCYWRLVRDMAASGLFDIASHIDLPKKFGFAAMSDLSREMGEALDAVADSRMTIEINTAGWHAPVRDAYPTQAILEQALQRGIAVTMSADAHHPDHLLRDFDRAAARLADAGYTQVARFRGRERWLEDLTIAR